MFLLPILQNVLIGFCSGPGTLCVHTIAETDRFLPQEAPSPPPLWLQTRLTQPMLRISYDQKPTRPRAVRPIQKQTPDHRVNNHSLCDWTPHPRLQHLHLPSMDVSGFICGIAQNQILSDTDK